MQRVEHWAGDVPVQIMRLEIQRRARADRASTLLFLEFISSHADPPKGTRFRLWPP